MGLRPYKDERRRQLNPAEEASAGAVEAPRDPAELSEEGVPALHRAADRPYPRGPRPPTPGGLHAEARGVGPRLRGPVAVRPVGPRTRQVTRVGVRYRGFGRRRLDDQRLQHALGLDPVVGARLGDGRPQWQAVFVRGQVDGGAGLGAIYGAGAGVLAALLGRLLGAIHQDLVPVDAVQLLIPLGHLLPGPVEAIVLEPGAEALLDRVPTREARGDEVPADPRDQDVKQALQAGVVAARLAAAAAGDDRRQDRLEQRPDFVGHAESELGEVHRRGLRGGAVALRRSELWSRGLFTTAYLNGRFSP